MATYYVRPDGNNANAGTGSTVGQAWQTVQYALTNATLTTGVNYIYIAPGVYRESLTLNITPTSSNTLVISGDPTAAQFSGVTQGVVRLTNFATDTANPTSSRVFFASSKSYFTLENLFIDGFHNSGTFDSGMVQASNATNVTIRKCSVVNTSTVTYACAGYISVSSNNTNVVVERSYFQSSVPLMIEMPTSGTVYNPQVMIRNCHMVGNATALFIGGVGTNTSTSNGVNVYNCTLVAQNLVLRMATSNTSTKTTLYNTLLLGLSASSVGIYLEFANVLTENYNKIRGASTGFNISSFGANTITAGAYGIDLNYSRLVGLPNLSALQSYYLSPNANAGTSTGAPSTDIYGVAWTGPNPDIGAGTYNASVGAYEPTERNAGVITIAPGSTSQSIELYLGVTGLTSSSSGLSARYNRTRTASVSIPLVARTIAQAWTDGGFAEVDATNMPGVYRLDLPDAALAAGADDVTIVVRGASGTNGAVMTIKLSSGGLTSAQTASAVWDAATASYTNNGSFGLNVLRADQQNKAGNVTLHSSGNVNRVDADVHAIANDTDAATELKGALLHNGTDYISADLLTPVSAATSVHIGPYQLLADGLGADQPLDVNVGTATSIDVQVTDANGTGIDITGATVSAKVYNSGGTLVATYAGTATYADNGRLSFGLTTTVTNTSGTYTVTVTRTTGASDTQVFGPLKLYVRPV
jgi:hypothetical protein